MSLNLFIFCLFVCLFLFHVFVLTFLLFPFFLFSHFTGKTSTLLMQGIQMVVLKVVMSWLRMCTIYELRKCFCDICKPSWFFPDIYTGQLGSEEIGTFFWDLNHNFHEVTRAWHHGLIELCNFSIYDFMTSDTIQYK